jgi:drug/metabolite transporter (DMT)-like permease
LHYNFAQCLSQGAFVKRSPKSEVESAIGGTHTWIGSGLVLVSALGFTISLLISNMAFKDGIDVSTTNAIRYFISLFLLLIFHKIRGKQLKLPPRQRFTGLALGISVFMVGIGYLSATQYIPVSLAVLIFYTAPLFITIISRFTENEPITLMRLIAIILAFFGLALALEIQSLATLNWRGIAFAFTAALGYTSLVIISRISMRTADPQAVNIHCLAAGTVLFVAFMLFTGAPAGIIIQSSWLKLSISSFSLAVGYVTLFAGLEILGPVKTTMLMNTEPILNIMLEAILLGEWLSSAQLVGAGLVIVGIILVTRGVGKKTKIKKRLPGM